MVGALGSFLTLAAGAATATAMAGAAGSAAACSKQHHQLISNKTGFARGIAGKERDIQTIQRAKHRDAQTVTLILQH